MANNARIQDIENSYRAGIDPVTGKPLRLSNESIKNDIRRALRIVDRQDAIKRYRWHNLPDGMNGDLIERILYNRYEGMFFYWKDSNKFYFLPYTLYGSESENLDEYGRYIGVAPVPFNGVQKSIRNNLITTQNRKVQYGIKLDYVTPEDMNSLCVILKDYTNYISENDLPRSTLNDPICNLEAECIAYMRTRLIASTGVKGMRVNDADQFQNVDNAAKSVEYAAATGKMYIPILGNIEFQELAQQVGAKPEEYLEALQSVDNFRLSLYGLTNGGLFEKKAHMLQSEQQATSSNVGLVYQDGLDRRQEFCDIVNSIWGLGIWCEACENEIGDVNMDGYPDQEQSNGGEVDANDQEI